jgi:hypothetical protein
VDDDDPCDCETLGYLSLAPTCEDGKATTVSLSCGGNTVKCWQCTDTEFNCDKEDGCISAGVGNVGDYTTKDDCEAECDTCGVDQVVVSLWGVDDDAWVGHNGNTIYSGQGNSGNRTVNETITDAAVGDVISAQVFDGWGTHYGGQGKVTVKYLDGSVVELPFISVSGTSAACSGTTAYCSWPNGDYWKSPAFYEYHDMGNITIPPSSNYCRNEAP